MTAPDYSVMDITDHPPGDRRGARIPPENQDRCARSDGPVRLRSAIILWLSQRAAETGSMLPRLMRGLPPHPAFLWPMERLVLPRAE